MLYFTTKKSQYYAQLHRVLMRFSAPVQTGPGAHPVSYTMVTRSFLGVKRLERGVDHPLYLASTLKKEYTYTSTPPLGLQGELYLTFTFTHRAV
jgi:hypothetical protein